MKLLLHSCCGPCSTYPVKVLKEEGIEITSFWYNPNIHPYTEYKNRYETYKKFMADENIPVLERNEYGLKEFVKNVCDMEDPRCKYCYDVRFELLAKTAKEKGFDAFSTTLLVSPYQNHELIIKVAEEKAKKYGVDFYYKDFRVGFREGQQIARDLGMYMQKYCGCIFSEEERYAKKIEKDKESNNV